MSFKSNGYTFKPHEMPIMIGSPASPDHPKRRRIAYLVIGILLAMACGLQNGLMMAALPEITAQLRLTVQETGWVQVSYYMAYACMSVWFFKIRQHFGLNVYVRWVLIFLLAANGLQLWANSFAVEIASRAFSGIAASGLLVLSMFYLMQAFPGAAKVVGLALALGLMQLGIPLARATVPYMVRDGEVQNVFWLAAAITVLCIGSVSLLPIPPGQTKKTLTKLDWISFTAFASGIALFCAFLVQGRIVWWTTSWLGWLLAGSIALVGLAFLIESHRENPMLDISWISTPQIFAFGLTGVVVRFFTSEQTVGAAGLMSALGMSDLQMTTFYIIAFFASLLGIVMSIVQLDLDDIRRPVVISMLGIAIASWLEVNAGMNTRPVQLYVTQAIVAFCTLYFMGPMLLEGLTRALAKSPYHIMSFSAVFGLSQSVGGLIGVAICSAFVTIRTHIHLADITQHLTLTDPNVVQQINVLAKGYASQSSDMAVLQSKAVSTLVSQATANATVLAYNDLSALIGAAAFTAFVFSGLSWLYRRYKKIDIIAKEKTVLYSLLKSPDVEKK